VKKHLTILVLLILSCACFQTVWAQAADGWVSISLKGEELTVWMPQSHEVKSREFSFDQFKLNGSVYSATSEGVDLSVWSLVDERGKDHGPASGDYLDACADLVWESLLKPLRDKVPKDSKRASRMSFERELLMDGLPPGREYDIVLDGRRGLTRFFVADQQIYAFTVLNLDTKNLATAQRFIFSFGPKRAAPPPTDLGYGAGAGEMGPGVEAGIGPGRDGKTGGGDRKIVGSETPTGANGTDNRVFSGREVTAKARVLAKPEPQYTESARKYAVHGTVIIRCIFSSSGEVVSLAVKQRLPHGLTERALSAAREIKFTPAVKDGRAVSMYMQLEYNFNLY
jgi:TonB family protein